MLLTTDANNLRLILQHCCDEGDGGHFIGRDNLS